MGLIQPSGPSWAYYSHNMSQAFTSATFGTQVASGVSSADGSDIAVLSALSHDAEYLRLAFSANPTAGVDNNALMDILIDPAGGTSWSVLIPSLAVGGLSPHGGSAVSPQSGPSGWYDFPLWIPAGATLGARARNAGGTNQTFSVAMFAYGGNRNPTSWWCGQRVSAIGTDPANSRGSSHTPGASGSFSSWANFGSTLGEACGAVQWAVMGEHVSNWALSRCYEFEFGVGSVRYGGPFLRALSASEFGTWWPQGPLFHQFPAGTQFMCRGRSSGTVTNPLSVAAYAVH
jgi:hypothetical protein